MIWVINNILLKINMSYLLTKLLTKEDIERLPSQAINEWVELVVNETTIEYYLGQFNLEFMLFFKFPEGIMYDAEIIHSLEKMVRASVVG